MSRRTCVARTAAASPGRPAATGTAGYRGSNRQTYTSRFLDTGVARARPGPRAQTRRGRPARRRGRPEILVRPDRPDRRGRRLALLPRTVADQSLTRSDPLPDRAVRG